MLINNTSTIDTQKSRENYLRVTTILYPFSGLQNVDATVLSKAANKGTRVHKICESIIQGYGEFDIDDDVWGYVESFKKWWSPEIDVVKIEERFWDDDLQITGQADLIINENGLIIVDFKTSYKPSKTWQIQGCAYAYLARKSGYDIQKIQFLHLNKHGKLPKIHEYSVDDDSFLAVYKTYKHFF